MHSLIIHMSSATARRANVDRLLEDLPNAAAIEAVDGRDPDQTQGVEVQDGDMFSPRYPFPLRPAEIGVFLSHRKCWQMIVDEGWDFAVIAEDDLAVDPGPFAQALQIITDHANPDSYVRMPFKQREKPTLIVAEEHGLQFFLPKVIGLHLACQVVGRVAAERLLSVTERFDRPVDTFLQMHWITGQPVHTMWPCGVREVGGQIGGSTIQTKKPGGSKLSRELRRFQYRAKVAGRPQSA